MGSRLKEHVLALFLALIALPANPVFGQGGELTVILKSRLQCKADAHTRRAEGQLLLARSLRYVRWSAGTKGPSRGQPRCSKGWGGNRCAVCTTNEGCTESTGDPEAFCSNDLTFSPGSEVRHLSLVKKRGWGRGRGAGKGEAIPHRAQPSSRALPWSPGCSGRKPAAAIPRRSVCSACKSSSKSSLLVRWSQQMHP